MSAVILLQGFKLVDPGSFRRRDLTQPNPTNPDAFILRSINMLNVYHIQGPVLCTGFDTLSKVPQNVPKTHYLIV